MREMKWTYQEYLHTPAAIVEEIWTWIKTQRQMEQEEVEKARGKRKR
jgi:predicted XRE-type DNA-binding protein